MAKRKRKSISTTTRFEVFKRDSFKCQYCGRCAPEVVLELDHIHPHSKNGSDEVLNLITSCWDCNNGKRDRLLDDNTVIKRQRDQLEELQERREQLDMMLRWRDANVDLDKQALDAFVKRYNESVPGWYLNESGVASARKLVRKYGLARALDALGRAVDYKLRTKDGKATQDCVEAILKLTFVFAEPDDVQALYRIRARLRKRWNYSDDGISIGLLKRVLKLGVSVDEIEIECDRMMGERNTSFGWWRAEMENWIADITEKKDVEE